MSSLSSSVSSHVVLLNAIRQYGFPRLTVHKLRRWLNEDGVLSSTELCSYCYSIAVAGETLWKLNAYERLFHKDDILEQAHAADERRRQQRQRQQQHQQQRHDRNLINNNHNHDTTTTMHSKHNIVLSALDGIPISIKSNIAIASQPLTAGSRILGGGRVVLPSSTSNGAAIGYNANVTERCVYHCGAILMGCTTMDEFGMGSLGSHIVQQQQLQLHDASTTVRNPLPYMRRMAPGGTTAEDTFSSSFWDKDDAITLSLLRLPHDAILESHATVITAFNDSCEISTNHDDTYETKSSMNDCDYYAGGSSCGGAVSVAHGSSIVSIGSDTGGSIRLPAAWCGIVGFKPSYGILSRHGLVSYASSLDTIGILAPSVACATTTFDAILHAHHQHHPQNHQQQGNNNAPKHTSAIIRDSTQSVPSESYLSSIRTVATTSPSTVDKYSEEDPTEDKPLSGIKIGIPAAFSVHECPTLVTDAWSRGAEWLERHGAIIVTTDIITPETIQSSLAAYYVLVSAEASSNLSRYDGFRYGLAATAGADVPYNANDDIDMKKDDGSSSSGPSAAVSFLERQAAMTRTQGFGREVIRRILCGTSVLSSDRFHTHYEAAAQLRAILTEQFRQSFRTSDTSSSNDIYNHHDKDDNGMCDLLLVPTCIFPAPRIGGNVDPTQLMANDIMTVPISLAGLPSISVPFGNWDHHDGYCFPIGLQLVASRHDEATLLRAAAVLAR